MNPLSVKYTKRVAGAFFGMGRNGSICNASIHLATHMDGEKHFYPELAAPLVRFRWKNGLALASSLIFLTWSAIPAFTLLQ